MNISEIYKNRFNDIDGRRKLWQILVQDFFQNFVPKRTSVFELACGYGEFINNIKCQKKYAIDINPVVKKYLNKDIIFFNETATKISIKDSQIDLIFASNFFEHITKAEIISVIKEAKRVLKPKGRFLILQPNIRFCSKDYWMFFDHITPIDDRALIEVFSGYGFKCRLDIERFLPYTTKSKLPQSDLFVRLYLRLPMLWRIFGQQSFLIFEK
jgi:ubiquinone/menaquinone biosynthesis C-methylase UbiE